MAKFWIKYGMFGACGDWEEIECDTLDEADDEAYRLAMEVAESEIDCGATDKNPYEEKTK